MFSGKCQPEKVFFAQTFGCKETRHHESLEFSVLGTDRVMKPFLHCFSLGFCNCFIQKCIIWLYVVILFSWITKIPCIKLKFSTKSKFNSFFPCKCLPLIGYKVKMMMGRECIFYLLENYFGWRLNMSTTGKIYNKWSKTPLVTCPRSESCSEWHNQHRVLCLKGNFERSICSRSSKVCGNMRSYETTC